MNEFLEKEEAILKMLKTVFDPEIPVNVYDLGLIYGIEVKEDGVCEITMTLTAPSCPAGDFLVEDIRQKVGSVDGIKDVNAFHIENDIHFVADCKQMLGLELGDDLRALEIAMGIIFVAQ